MSDRISDYVQNRLLVLLGCPGSPFELEPCHAGVHGELYFLSAPERAPLALKIYSRRSRLRSAAASLRLLSGLGIAVPGIVCIDEDRRLFGRRGMHVLCQERIVGDSLERLQRTPEIITGVAELFAAVHRNRRDTWGVIGGGRRKGLREYLRKKFSERLAGWACCDDAPAALQKKILDRFAAGEPAVAGISSFSLSHTDPNRNNIIRRSSDGRLFLLDTGSLRYLPRAIDYFMLQAYFCFGSPGDTALFEQRYFRDIPGPEIAQFRESQDFFRLYVTVLFIHDLTTRFAALSPESPYRDEFSRLIPLAKQALLEALEEKSC